MLNMLPQSPLRFSTIGKPILRNFQHFDFFRLNSDLDHILTKSPLWHLWGAFFVVYTQDPTKLLRSCNEVATKLDPLRIPCASPASPHPSIKESTKGGGRPPLWRRRFAPPSLWMGVWRMVRHKESLTGPIS